MSLEQVISAVESAMAEPMITDKQQQPPARPVWRHRHRNWQRFDKITIHTVPRFKTSSLSGNEWRFNARIDIKKKGRILLTSYAHDTQSAAEKLPEILSQHELTKAVMETSMEDLCDQEGCSEPWTRSYKLKKLRCADCGHTKDDLGTTSVAKFCDRHATRGDCGIEDSDDNYEKDELPDVPVREEDRARSGFIVIQ